MRSHFFLFLFLYFIYIGCVEARSYCTAYNAPNGGCSNMLHETFYEDLATAQAACRDFVSGFDLDPATFCVPTGNHMELGMVSKHAGHHRYPGDDFPFHFGIFYAPLYSLAATEPVHSCDAEGNPCDVISGRKTQQVTDFSSSNLKFSRYYDSAASDPGINIGANWRHSFDTTMDNIVSSVLADQFPPKVANMPNNSTGHSSRKSACINGWGGIKNDFRRGSLSTATATFTAEGVCEVSLGENVVATLAAVPVPGYALSIDGGWGSNDAGIHTVSRPDGSYYTFVENTIGDFEEINGYHAQLIRDGDDWLFYDKSNIVDRFNASRLVSRQLADGQLLTMAHDSLGRLETITSSSGRVIQLRYADIFDVDGNQIEAGQIDQITYAGGVIGYTYDSDNNLSTVTYEDASTVQYHYEDNTLPNHLTGITDQRSIRYAIWTYDGQGRATSSLHAAGADNTSFVYSPQSTTVTDALGAVRIYHLMTKGRRYVVDQVTGDRCDNCNRGDLQHRSYNAKGLLTAGTDWIGNTIDYLRDNLGRVTFRTVGVGTAEAATVETDWNTTYSRPDEIRYLNSSLTVAQKTGFTYNSRGQVLTRTVTDPATSKTRVTTYSYYQSPVALIGKLSTIDGPRIDVTDITSYAYYTSDAGNGDYLAGDLHTITNAAGHVTEFLKYDAAGRPLRIEDPNNIKTDLDYDLRGRLTTVTAEGESIHYAYDSKGNLNRVTHADGSYIEYGYDEASRLTVISDNVGNNITYTLDAAGNRITEENFDTSVMPAALHRTLSRVYDKLGQLDKLLDSGSVATEFDYDAAGNQKELIDAVDRTTGYDYDALDRLTKVTDAALGGTEYDYDTRNNLVTVTDPLGHITRYEYDGLDNLKELDSPDTGTTSYQYDAAGNRTQ